MADGLALGREPGRRTGNVAGRADLELVIGRVKGEKRAGVVETELVVEGRRHGDEVEGT